MQAVTCQPNYPAVSETPEERIVMTPRSKATDPEPLPEPIIGFSSKELFLEINRKIDLLTSVLNKKVDRKDHEQLEAMVLELRTQSISLATQKATEERLNSAEMIARRQWVGIILTAGLSAIGLILTVVLHLFKP